MYSLVKNLLFCFNPERSHQLALSGLRLAHQFKLTNLIPKPIAPCNVMGLQFANPVGLAAGFDKNGDYIDALAALGFGFIEIGTVTPKPQPGNPPPRLFRLQQQEAIINRLGFNNKGCDYVVEKLKQTRYQGILGVNIGKNRDTSLENAEQDYVYAFQQVAPYASYVTVNISSPNTESLRTLQQGDLLVSLLKALKMEQTKVFDRHKKYVPLVVKIAPDLTNNDLQAMAEIFLAEKIDGVIATNTTVDRAGVDGSPYATEAGGLSGRPLFRRSTEVISLLHELLKDKIPLIAAGGILSAADAKTKRSAGAKLVQIYTGFIYHGPRLIREMINNE
jgi:dihydroorotate dehydrogenase